MRDQGNILRQTSNNYYSETIHTSTLSDLNRDTSFVWTTPSVIPTTRGNARDIPTSTTQVCMYVHSSYVRMYMIYAYMYK